MPASTSCSVDRAAEPFAWSDVEIDDHTEPLHSLTTVERLNFDKFRTACNELVLQLADLIPPAYEDFVEEFADVSSPCAWEEYDIK
jgi:hypothetical protein